MWMRNRNEPYLFRDVYPNFSHFLFCSNDTEYSDVEIEAFFGGHHFYQGTGFSVLVFFIVPAVLAVRSFSSGVKLSTLICCDKAGNASSTANKISKLSRFISV